MNYIRANKKQRMVNTDSNPNQKRHRSASYHIASTTITNHSLSVR